VILQFARLRLFLPLVSLLLVLPATQVSAQAQLRATSTALGSEDSVFRVDRGPIDHLGHGTPEDLYIDLGAGAAVSVFSGNLVVSIRPLVRGDAVADSQMALTYNHLDVEGAASLATGWSYDLGRRWLAGAWGDRILIDGDGFQDSFLAGPLPNRRELLELGDDVVRAWRRQTSLADRRAGGGERVFRQMIASDPMFFGEMRLRFLGPPRMNRRVAYSSQLRGQRTLQLDDRDEYVVLTRHDGGRELYSKQGMLEQVEPAHGPVVKVVREGRRIASVEVGGTSRYHIDHDSYGRMTRIRSGSGRIAELQYVDRYLHRLKLPGGGVELSYDAQGRLVKIDGPEGKIEVTFDDSSGRVETARGPLGDLQLGDLVERADRLEVSVSGSAAGKWTCSWSASRRERRLESGGSVHLVRFEEDRPLPLEWSSPSGHIFLEWTDGGRLSSVRSGRERVQWLRSAEGALKAVVDLGGAEASMVRGERGSLLGWVDPAGRRTRLNLDSFALPSKLEGARGSRVQVQRTRGGLLRQVESAGHGSVILRRDSRGLVRKIASSTGASASFKRDELSRITSFESSGGLRLDLSYGADGRVEHISDGQSESALSYGDGGVLLGWKGARGSLSVARDSGGQLEGLSQGGRSLWALRRDGDGRVRGLVLADGVEREVQLDGDGIPLEWQHQGGAQVSLSRNVRGRVDAWSDALLGDGSLSLDRWGRAAEVRRGAGRWLLERDRSGLALVLTDPVGASSRLTLDPSGRVQMLSAPDQLTWHFKHDPLGRLTELRDRTQAWTLRHGRSGRPEIFADPRGRELRIEWDSAGRWRSLRDGGLAVLEVAYGKLGPTRVGESRRSYGAFGELISWGTGNNQRRWKLERDQEGRVSAAVLEDSRGGSRARGLIHRQLVRDAGGRVVSIGRWLLSWERGALASVVETGDSKETLVEVERDSVGRAVRLSTRSGHRAEVLRDARGDVRELRLLVRGGEGLTWRLVRDSAARVVGVRQAGGLNWRLLRDPLGRVRQWQLTEMEEPFSVDFLPLDGTVPSVDNALAVGLGVTEPGTTLATKLSGSRRVQVHLPGDREVLRFDEVRSAGGALQAVTNVWETTLGPWEPGVDGPDDPIGDQLSRAELSGPVPRATQMDGVMVWGGAPLAMAGEGLFPSVDGSGAGLSGQGRVRLSTAGGMTVSWLGSGAALDGLQVPGRSGQGVSPGDWGAPFLQWRRTDETPSTRSDAVRGTAAGVEHWWSSLSVAEDGYARLPRGVAAASRAWRRPRQELYSRAAMMPPDQPVAGMGAALPPVPGASRLLPGPAGSLSVSPLAALVMAGDLSPRVVEHESWLPVAVAAWSVEVPGAALLTALAERRAWPSVPASWRRAEVSGMSTHLAGFVTAEGCRRGDSPAYQLRPAVSGLPAGVVDVLPGRSVSPIVAATALPIHGRAGAVEALSDDPLVPGAARRALSDSDSILLFLRSFAALPPAYQRFVAPNRSAESWSVELPSGLRLVVDQRGRLLSAAVLGRLHRSWGDLAVSRLGASLIRRGDASSVLEALASPPWLPSGLSLPEARWGIVPARGDLAVSATLVPVSLLDVTGSTPFADSDGSLEE